MLESNLAAVFLSFLFGAAVVLSAFAAGPAFAGELTLKSPAFENGAHLPQNSGYLSGNISPPLEWSLPPPGTRSFALIVDDPDARGWVHWIAWNIPFTASRLPENVAQGMTLPDGTRQGLNDFGKIGYGGPCPPSGIHRYSFRIVALDTVLDLAPGAERYELVKAIGSHALQEARLTGTFRSEK